MRKTIAILGLAGMMLCLAACRGGSSSQVSNEPQTISSGIPTKGAGETAAQATEAPATEAAAETKTEPAAETAPATAAAVTEAAVTEAPAPAPTAAHAPESTAAETAAPESTAAESTKAPVTENAAQTTEAVAEAQEPVEGNAVVYIGMEGDFHTFPVQIDGEVTAEALIGAMAELTGWNLDLADAVTTGKGGATVCFAPTSSLFTGAPDPQVEQFHVYDDVQLIASILDSVQATLQHFYVSSLGDPSSMDIWYVGEGYTELTFPSVGARVPMDAPYSGLVWD